METVTKIASEIPCLVCNALVLDSDDKQSLSSSSTCYLEDRKRISLFLLRNLLEIPKPLVNFDDREDNGQCSRNVQCSRLIVTCEQCKEAIQQASLIYGEIRESARRFRAIQKEIVETLKTCIGRGDPGDLDKDVVEHYRKLVNECDYNGFGFPFIVQDEVDYEEEGASSTINVCSSDVKGNEKDSDLRETKPCEVVVKQEDEENHNNQEILLIFPEDEEKDHDQRNQMDSEDEDQSDFQVSEVESEDAEDDHQEVSLVNSAGGLEDDDQDSQNDLEEDTDDDFIKEQKNKEICSKSANASPTVNLLSSFICKKCLQRFPTKEELDDHESKVHLKDERGTLPCPLKGCNKIYTCSGFPQHFRISHRKPPFICKDCAQEFSNPNQVLIHHKQAHPPQPQQRLIIKPQKTKGPEKLKNLPEKPIKVKVRTRKARAPQKSKDRMNPNNPFPCPLCHHSLKTFSSLRAHMKRSHPNNSIPLHDLRLKFFSANTPPSLPEERKLTRPKFKFLGISTFELEYPHIICERNAQGKFPCPWTDPSPCSKIVGSKHELHRHIKVNHLNVPLYTCTWSEGGEGEKGTPVCGKTFSTRHNYLEHYDRHRGTPKYKCEDCGMTFYKRNPFVRHQQRMHSDETFICEICGRGFSCKDHLYMHKIQKHRERSKEIIKKAEEDDGPGPGIICDLCGKLLKSQTTLKTHKEAVHEKVPGKFCCHLCANRYRVVTHLNIHLWQRHKFKAEGYEPKERVQVARKDKLQCPVKGCRVLFTMKKSFERHRIEVHGEDGNKMGQWNCKYCGKNFFHRNKWEYCEKRHENWETRPEKCEVCGKGFPTKHHLRFHQRNTHKMQLESKRGQRE